MTRNTNRTLPEGAPRIVEIVADGTTIEPELGVASSVSAGLCVSRYDAFLYTHTTAKLSYQSTPVLVQVSLLHNGSVAGGPPANHPTAVLRGLQDYVDQFCSRIQAANK